MFGVYRFLLALNVVFYHVLDVPGIGPLAVYSFFVLSGFLMTMIMQQTYGYSVTGIKKYAINRFLRLYPTYWVLLFIAVAIMFLVTPEYSASFHSKMLMPENASQWAANVLMFYPELNPVNYPYRISPATWALSIEIFFYILIGLGLSKNRVLSCLWLAVSLMLVLFSNIEKGRLVLSYGNVFSASLPFALGSVLFHFKDKIKDCCSKAGKFIPLVFCIHLIIVVFCGYAFPDKFWFIFAMATWSNIILSSFLTIYLFGLDKSSFNKKWDKELGDLSYPIYIIHWSGALLASWLLSSDGVKTSFVFILGLLITLTISFVINRYVSESVEKIRLLVKK